MSTTMNFTGIDAMQFADIWKKFDVNESGIIEGKEVETFFKELSRSLLKKEPANEEYEAIKKTYMSAYCKNDKLSMGNVAKMLLPPDEAFILLFRRKIPLNSSVSFMKIWRKYDQNNSGFICVSELKNFIGDYVFLAGATVTDEKLQEYAESIMKLFDRNGDELLDIQDMARLINVSENFLLQFKIEDGSVEERRRDFETIFSHYDQDGTGALEGAEVDGFVKDMMETIMGSVTSSIIDQIKQKLLEHLDFNGDGHIQKSELALCLGIHLNN